MIDPIYESKLMAALSRAKTALDQKFRPIPEQCGLSLREWQIMREIARGEARPISVISRECGMQGPSVSRIVYRLVQGGLVLESNSPNRRTKCLALTKMGARRLELCEQAVANLLAEIMELQGMTEMEKLIGLLNGLADTCETVPVRVLEA